MSKYDKAGLAMIPSGYKDSKVYSLIPNSSVGDFDFTRASTATRVNKDGLIDTVASGVPRLEYPIINGVVGDTPSLLLEPSRTNLITYSEDIGQWSQLQTSVNSDETISPDGSQNADLLRETAVNNYYSARNLITVTSGVEYTFTFFAKKKDYDWIQFARTNDGGDYANFNIANGTIGNNSGSFATNHNIEDYGNGWYKCIVSYVTGATTTGVGISLIRSNVSARYETYQGDVTKGTYIWGGQFEQGSYPTSYIPTSGSTVTRAAETCIDSGSTSEINSQEGVLFVESSALADDGTIRSISAISDTTATNRVLLFYHSTTNTLRGNVTVGGVTQANIDATIAQVENSKIALKYKENDFELWINGFEVGTDTSGSTFSADTLSELAFDNGGGASAFKGKAKQIITFKEALSDSELEDLTSWDSFNEMATAQEYIIK